MLATTSLGAIWSSCSPDFGAAGVLDRFGQIAPKVLIATGGLPVRGQGASTRRPPCGSWPRSCPGSPPSWASVTCRTASAWQALTADAGAAGVRRRALRSPRVHPLLVGHHRSAEGHRARRRRHAAPAPEGAPAAHGPAPGRPAVLLHHLRLDDVELAGERPRERRHAGALRRLADPPGLPARCGGMADEEGITVFGTSARYLAGLAKSGVRPRDACRLATLRTILSTGSPLAPETFDYGVRRREGRRAARAPSPAAPTSWPASRWATRCCPCAGASCSARRWAWRWRSSTRTGTAAGAGPGRAGLHPAVPVPARRLLGRRGRGEVPARLLRALSRRVGPRRLRGAHGRPAASSSTAGPTRC